MRCLEMIDKRVGYYICINCSKKVHQWVGIPVNNKVLCKRCAWEVSFMIRHEFNYGKLGLTGSNNSLTCLHCKKLFVYCVNRDGTLNTKCVKRKDLSNKPQ